MPTPVNADRVARNAPRRSNERIAREIDESVAYHAENPHHIEERLQCLEKEWDVERAVGATAASAAGVGIALGAFLDRRWLALPTVVLGFLAQHALLGWCPPSLLFRRLGVRTRDEILRERYCLRALRGDLDRLCRRADGDPRSRAKDVLLAITE